MPYNGGRKMNVESMTAERQLLVAGFNYTEISERTGHRAKTISERNRLIHKVDIWKAFRARVGRDGIPCRLNVSDAFGNWFAGFFDGEGNIILFTRPSTANPKYSEFRLGIRILIRDDDAHIMTRIYDNLKVGRIHKCNPRDNTNPAIQWICERMEDLAEIIVPLFDRYPLYTKKAKELAFWRPVVISRYFATLGGYSRRCPISDEDRAAFYHALKEITRIRTYTRT
jgi:hypothetical protein